MRPGTACGGIAAGRPVPAVVACCTHEATALGWACPLHTWRLSPALASACCMACAATAKVGTAWMIGM